MSDPVSDMLTRIRNGYMAHLEKVTIPYSKYKEELAGILVKLGFAKSVKTEGNTGKTRMIEVILAYEGREPKLTDIQKVSKPSLKVYVNHSSIPKVLGGLGKVVISTSKGLMTGKEAKAKGLGGEVVFKIW